MKHGGAPIWTTGAFDPELNPVAWNTGNAAPWNCHVRKGDDQWSAATVGGLVGANGCGENGRGDER